MKLCKQHGILIDRVIPGSAAAELGLRKGDLLLSVNGIRPQDLIAYRYLIADEQLTLKVRKKGGRVVTHKIIKGFDTDLGIVFQEDCFDGIRRCRNKCVFCFVDQLPTGLRPTLYEKDDDYRLSFLHGNFITLTNLKEGDIARIVSMKLSPLYISVHTTSPLLRGRMLGLKKAAPVLDLISLFASRGITMHIQVVLCPDWNDGDVLEQTICQLAAFWPQVASVGVVPVGLTKYRQHLPKLRSITRSECRKLINQASGWQKYYRRAYGVSFVYLADEFYLKAGLPFPLSDQYDGFPQLENGIGLGRLFYEDFSRIKSRLPEKLRIRRQLFIATSHAGAQVLSPVVHRLNFIKNLKLKMLSIPNTFFGPRITVTGLLAGQDLMRGLKRVRGEEVLIPRIMLRQDTPIFLDGLSVEELEARSGCSIYLVEPSSIALVETICMLGGISFEKADCSPSR
ncbi:MAG TPA: DUF512 domain-containing protein [Syntrophomonadaceae bacterium]|nr:DUF512 domain-containing protein [Syntrophomonadaceae bacterium]